MWVSFRDIGHIELLVQESQIDCVMLPSPISPGDGKFRIVCCGGLVICDVTQQTAQDVKAKLIRRPVDVDSDVRMAQPLSLVQS